MQDYTVYIQYRVDVWLRKTLAKIWRITSGLPNFTIQILTMSHDIHIQRKQTSRNSPKFYLSKVSDEKFAKVFLRQKFVLYGS